MTAINANRPMKQSAECGSTDFADTSAMDTLCPECAHHLYGYDNCPHTLLHDRCSRCGWDGSRSKYILKLIRKRTD